MNLGNVKSGSKIILLKELVIPSHSRYGMSERRYPKNLVLSLNSLKINRMGTTLMFQVIKAKAIKAKYYSNIDLTRIWPNVRFSGNDAEIFLRDADYRSFDDEYIALTK
jgi:hypothetical protein